LPDREELKRRVALAAMEELPGGGIIGLGTGSTVRYFIDALGAAVARGHAYVGVPTSDASRAQAAAIGIPLLADDGPWAIDVTVDGADEIDDALNLVKGAGGALTREKIVNVSSRRNIIIANDSKLSERLGERQPVPVEVLPFGHLSTRQHLARFGTPLLRRQDGDPFRTDSGHLIYDLRTGAIDDPRALDAALHQIPGVIETGLFIARADLVLIADETGVRRLTPHG
jgi:ribose 5-phosphate isomerase A